MNRFAFYTSSLLAVCALCAWPGCESGATKPAASSGDKSASASQVSEDEMADAAAALKQDVAPQARQTPQMLAGHPPTDQQPAARPQPASDAQLPAGHPPITGMTPPVKPSAKNLVFEAPEGWTAEPPANSMRKAQFKLPAVEGDAADGELVVFFFGVGEGGPPELNIARWRGMFKKSDGSPLTDDDVRIDKSEADGMPVTICEFGGTYTPMMMPGGSASSPEEAYRMIGAIIETDAGPWFIKAVGPDATMAAQRELIEKYVKSAKVEE
jgi:hypothetical protein